MSTLKFIPPQQWLDPARSETVLFDTPRGAIKVSSMALAAEALSARLRLLSGQRVALCVQDSALFTLGLIAIWDAHKEAILLPEGAAGFLQAHRQYFDILLHEEEVSALDCPQIALHLDCFSKLKVTTPQVHLELEEYSAISFFTSGSTGAPKLVRKTLALLTRENKLIFDKLASKLEGTQVCATVYPQHLFGLTFRLFLPLCFGLTARSRIIHYTEELCALYPGRYFLVTSPVFIHHLDFKLKAPQQIVCFSSAGGFLPDKDAQAMIDWSGADLFEIYGSTESGVMGWRDKPHTHFTPFPGVNFVMGQQSYQLHSPIIAESELTINDILEFYPDGSFRPFGRFDSIVKLDDKRVSLSAIKRCLLTCPEVDDAEVVTYKAGERLCIGAVVVLKPEYAAAAHMPLMQHLRAVIGASLGEKCRPRRILFCEHMPQNSMGKRSLSALQELFA